MVDSPSSAQGASQIYFVNLNGGTAGGPTGATSNNCIAAGAGINAVQSTQSGQSGQ